MNIPLFAHVATLSFLFPVVSGIYNWKTLDRTMRIFAIFCCLSLIHVVIEFIWGRMGESNQFLINLYWLMEFEFILYLYFQWIKNKILKEVFQYFGLAYLLFWTFNQFYFDDPTRFNEPVAVVSFIFLIVASVLVFYHLILAATDRLANAAIFWIGTGIILYCSGTIIVFTLSNTVMKMGLEYFISIWYINWSFIIIANLSFARSFWCKIF